MLHQHYRTIAQISSSASLKYLIRDYFQLPKAQALMPALLAKGLGQADLVLSLLRVRDQHRTMPVQTEAERIIEALVGHPILIGPSCLRRYRDPAPYVPIDRSPRITWVTVDNPRQPNTDAYHRWCEYQVGRSVAQLRSRGVTQRDIRRAVAHGWIRLAETELAPT